MSAALSLRAEAPWRVLNSFGEALHSASRWASPRNLEELTTLLARAREEHLPISLRGSGRSYGDASLNEGGISLDLRAMNRMLDWNPVEGIATVEPGLTIEGLWRRTLEDGYWPAVVPGTMFPTLGGCAAMNIHGKNNFAVGPFGEHILDLDLLTADGNLLRCSRTDNPEIFHSVIGGAGLLGVMTRLRIKLKKVESGLLRVEPIVSHNFDEMVDTFEERLPRSDYLVGWIDCMAEGEGLGRGAIHQANYLHAEEDTVGPASLHIERQVLPSTILGVPRGQLWRIMRLFFSNDLGMRFLNFGKFQSGRLTRKGSTYLQAHVAFAFLLDYVPGWWRAYGPKGLAQIQVFVPAEAVRTVIPDILRLCQERDYPSYLGVFKRHRRDEFLLSHAVDGYSLALDFAIHDRERLDALAREITARVLDAGGRFYLAKDALLQAGELARAYGDRIPRFLALKSRLDPAGLWTSDLARRLALTA